ncbi:DUF4288 domain-containing protein [bacterium]|nr:DUF4288 domain-containing protein [bacterium]
MGKAAKKTTPATNRFSAKLLFQYRSEGGREVKRLCEERIITFEARSPRNALQVARSAGRKAQFDAPSSFYNVQGAPIPSYMKKSAGRIFFEFVGVLDLIELTTICEPNEVWYAIRRHDHPEHMIPSDKELLSRT